MNMPKLHKININLPFSDVDETKDSLAHRITSENLMDVYLDPLDHNANERSLLNEEDLDDLNCLNSSSTLSSAYKDTTIFHEFSNNIKFSNQLRLGRLKCRSLFNKLPEISLLLAQTKLSVLALTETWINDD